MGNEAKIDKKLIYLLIVALVFLVIALMLPKREREVKTYSKTNNVNVVSLSEEDKSGCKNWIEEIRWEQVEFKKIRGEKHTTSLDEHNVSMVGVFTQKMGEQVVEREFTCIKNLDGLYGINHNWIFIVEINGDIVGQDM